MLLRVLFTISIMALAIVSACRTPEPAVEATPRPAGSTATGDLRFHTFRSEVFGNERQLRVLLPDGYGDRANRGRRYPVLYLNDGQNLFDTLTAPYRMEWRADETVRALTASGAIPPMIVVGIDNAGGDRAKEYLPWLDERLRQMAPDPQGTRYPDFLIDEVMPFINARYRTLEGPEHTGLGGSSLGGLIALHTAAARPGVFGRLLVESPSVFVAERRILSEAEQAGAWLERVFVAIGTNEMFEPACDSTTAREDYRPVADTRALESILRRAGLGSERLRVEVERCAVHNEAAWARRLPEALRFLYGRRDPTD